MSDKKFSNIETVSRYSIGKRLILMIVLAILAAPYLQSGVNVIYLKNRTGIQAVDYDRQNSLILAKTTDDNKSIMLAGHIVLTNYSHESVSFQMSIGPRSSELQSGMSSWFNHNIPLDEWTTNLDSFTLNPGENAQ